MRSSSFTKIEFVLVEGYCKKPVQCSVQLPGATFFANQSQGSFECSALL
jgi:hypothetical protein